VNCSHSCHIHATPNRHKVQSENQFIAHQADPSINHGTANVEVTNVFHEDCHCQSMFTVGGCHMKQVIHLQEDPVQASAFSGLSIARLDGTQTFTFMKTLARYLPQIFKADLKHNPIKDFDMTNKENISRASQSLPFVPCSMHIYTPIDVKMCTEHFKRSWHVPLKITFIGDSRTRNTMQEMAKILIKELNLHTAAEDPQQLMYLITNIEGRSNIPANGNNIEINYIFAPIIERKVAKPIPGYDFLGYGARDIFEVWSEGKSWINIHRNQTFHLPHLVVVNTGMWYNMKTPAEVAVSEFIHAMHIMTPILKRLSKITRVLWPLHGPIKENLAYTPDLDWTPVLDLMNSITWLKLRDSNVWLWDTRTILMLRQKQECFELYEAGLGNVLLLELGCLDMKHAGKDVERGAINMIWNLVCNSLLNMKTTHCCS
ncbi:unnamed protein product, partial [Meganyctiphanes norvegica]